MAPPAPGDTVPCHDCGLVLPLRNIEIDHQRPVAGSTTEPVCKVFRAMGLTQAGDPPAPKDRVSLQPTQPQLAERRAQAPD